MLKIVNITDAGKALTYDIWNREQDCFGGGNFLIDGKIVHNSILANKARHFGDLMLFNSMGHPGPMQSIPGAMENRNDPTGKWKRDLHPDILPILESTYGKIVFQEQLQMIWQKLGGFTAPEAQDARKAIAKKWTHKLGPIREKWLAGASRTLGRKAAEEWWTTMEFFGRYAFNRCLSKNTILTDVKTNISMTIEKWANNSWFPKLKSYKNNKTVVDECIAIHNNGEMDIFEIEFDNGDIEWVTLDHKFLCKDDEYHTIREIIEQRLDVSEIRP